MSTHAPDSICSSPLSEILSLPQPKTCKSRNPGFNSKTVCIPDDEVVTELEDRIVAKQLKEDTKKGSKRKKSRSRKKENRQQKQRRKKSGQKNCTDSESEAECVKCGGAYGESDEIWICCDSCDAWCHITCAEISEDEIPENFFVSNVLSTLFCFVWSQCCFNIGCS